MKELIKLKVGNAECIFGISFIYSIKEKTSDTCEIMLINLRGAKELTVNESYKSLTDRLSELIVQ